MPIDEPLTYCGCCIQCLEHCICHEDCDISVEIDPFYPCEKCEELLSKSPI